MKRFLISLFVAVCCIDSCFAITMTISGNNYTLDSQSIITNYSASYDKSSYRRETGNEVVYEVYFDPSDPAYRDNPGNISSGGNERYSTEASRVYTIVNAAVGNYTISWQGISVNGVNTYNNLAPFTNSNTQLSFRSCTTNIKYFYPSRNISTTKNTRRDIGEQYNSWYNYWHRVLYAWPTVTGVASVSSQDASLSVGSIESLSFRGC